MAKEGDGSLITQARLRSGKILQYMRSDGLAECTLRKLCRRVKTRHAFGELLCERRTIQRVIAKF